MKKLFYLSVRTILSLYNIFYFRRFRVIGKQNIPKDGGILFSPNHQNAFLDPLIVGVTCGKSVNSLTRSDVFGGPFQWFLDALQTMPIYRIRDGYASLRKNEAIFEKCHALLGKQENMMMFSEGQHHDEYYLLRLSKGSSRLALESQFKYSDKKIYLQPVGINYGNYFHAQHDCTVVYGKPICLQEYLDDYTENSSKAVNKVRDKLQNAMEDCLWIPKNDSEYVSKKRFINRHNTKLPFDEFKKQLLKSNNKLREKTKSSSILKIFIVLLSIPNLFPLLVIKSLIRLFKDHVFWGSVNYFGGLIVFLIWWVFSLILLTQWFSIAWGIAFLSGSLVCLYVRQKLIIYDL